jgi:hypothetical protein
MRWQTVRNIRLGWMALMLGWLGALAHNPDDPLHQRIHYDQPARTVKQLLADLSRQTGITLFAPSPLDTEIVLVSVQEMPLKTLMEHLATVTDGEWVKQPNGSYHLIRSPKLARECRERDDAQLLQGLKRAVAKKEIERLAEPLTEAQVRQICQQIKCQMQEIESQEISNPWEHPLIESLEKQVRQLDVGRRLIIRLVRRLDLRRLLTIPVGERRVFSNVRGRYLEPFGFEVGSLLAAYQREARWVYQVWTHPLDGFDEEWVKRFNERYGYVIELDYQWRQEPSQVPLTRLYLVVSRNSPNDFSFNTVLFSEDMKQDVGGGYWWIWLREEELESKDAEPGSGQSPSEASRQLAARVEWSESSRQFMEAYRAIRRATEPVAFPDVLDPAKVEPLSLVPSDVLRTYARQKGKSLIALVPDNLVWWLKGALEGHDALQMYEEDIRWWHDMQEQGDVLLLKPRWSSYWWGHRVDRLALSRWLHQLHQRGYPKLEDHLAMSQMYEHAGFEDTMLRVYERLILPKDRLLYLYNSQRFLNRLSAKQLDHLRAGGQLTLRELSPVQREMLLHDVYFGSSTIEKVYSISELATIRSEAEMERLAAAERESLEISLPHVLYPDGLPADLTIQINRTHPNMFDPYDLSPDTIGSLSIEEVGVFTARRAGVWYGFRSVKGLASEISSAENPPSGLDEEYAHYIQERVNRYKTNPLLPVRRTPFRLEVRLGGRYAVYFPSGDDSPLYDYEPLNEGKPATLDKLPDALKAEMEKWLKRLKESGSDGSEDGN